MADKQGHREGVRVVRINFKLWYTLDAEDGASVRFWLCLARVFK